MKDDQNLIKAYEVLQAMEAQVFSLDSGNLKEQMLDSLYLTAYELGFFDKAETHVRRYLDLLEKGDLHPYGREAKARYRFAILKTIETPTARVIEEAIARHELALEVAEKKEHLQYRVWNHLELGKLRTGDQARAHLQQCIDLIENHPDRDMDKQLNQARAAYALELLPDQPLVARALFADSLPDENTAWRAYGWEERMDFHWADNPKDEALEKCLAELAQIEALRRTQESDLGRGHLFSVWAEAFAWLSGRLLQEAGQRPGKQDLAKAFALAEKMRARSLADSLPSQNQILDERPLAAINRDLLTTVESTLQDDEALLCFQLNS